VGQHPFASMVDDHDSQRKVIIGKNRPPTEEETQAKV